MKYAIDSSKISFNGKKAKEVFLIIGQLCCSLGTDFLVVGAFSRDLILEQIFHTPPGVLTRDVDLAIYLSSWEKYNLLVDRLIADYGFKKGSKVHEFISQNGLQLDILPYGAIESNRYLSFPESPGFRINMVGFQEIRESSLEIVIDGEVSINIPTAEGMILLKLIAWNDRKPQDVSKKHVVDIGMIIDSYFHGSLDYISSHHSDVFDELPNFDEFFLSAIVIGRGIKKLLVQNSNSYDQVILILRQILDDKENSLFINQLASARRWEYNYAYKIVNYLYSNIIEEAQ